MQTELTTSQRFSLPCLAVLLLLAAILNGCAAPRKTAAPIPGADTPPPAVESKPVAGPAAALFHEAEGARQAGRLAEAEMMFERALRIEPRNPHYWYGLAQVKYRQGKYLETVQFCLKVESLAAKQPQLKASNKELLRQAREKSAQSP